MLSKGVQFEKKINIFTSETVHCCLNLRMTALEPKFAFVVVNTIVIYYQIFHLPHFLKTFQTRPNLGDQDLMAYEIFKHILYVSRIFFTNRVFSGEYIDDSIITTKVKAAILNEPTLKSTEISVKTFKGVVEMSGFVNTKAEINKAFDLARGVRGVTGIKNEMHVK